MNKSIVLLAVLLCMACDFWGEDEDHVALYQTHDVAPSLKASDIKALAHMGPTIIDSGVNFAVYSESATRMELLLFDKATDALPVQQFKMKKQGEVFNIFVEGIGIGQHYGFVTWGGNWTYDENWEPGRIDGFVTDVDGQGNRFNPNKLLIDPYARALSGEHDWSRGSAASGPARTQSTWGGGVKSIIMESDYEWSSHESTWRENRQKDDFVSHRHQDLIIYEVHLKGFSNNPASGVSHPGTYRGLGEKAAYLKDLGVTAVELLPVHEKPTDGGYWGYWTLNFFAPERTYAANTDPYEVINEFKWMVDQLHQADIEVIIDVVYNHTGEGGLWREKIYADDFFVDADTRQQAFNLDSQEIASLMSFRGLDNPTYYALSEDGKDYWDNTGVGHQTRPNHPAVRRLIMDSLRFYTEEMHVDGFRFDLAGILGEVDGDYNNWDDPKNTVLQDIIDDPAIQKYNARIISEPWTAGGNYGPLIGAYPNSTDKEGYGWYEWNARFRDWWRSFINYDEWVLNSQEADADGGFVIQGSQNYYAWNGRRPYHSVNFITAHDGFTLYDLLSFDEKRNGCGLLNPVCCDDPTSSWCDFDSGDDHNRSRIWESEPMKRQQARNLMAGLLVSHGTPMILGGDEWLRTQYGNNNAYSTGADNEWNWFRWGEWQSSPEKVRMHDFVRHMIAFRKGHAYAFAPSSYEDRAPFSYKAPDNSENPQWGGKQLLMHYYDDTWGPELAILINQSPDWVTFILPENRSWSLRVDTQSYYDDETYLGAEERDRSRTHNFVAQGPTYALGTYDVAPRSFVIFEDVD